MGKKIKLTKKAAKQFEQVRKKFKITKREFADFYNNVRKANKKTSTATFKEKAIYQPKYSYNISKLVDRQTFLNYNASVKKVLNRGYTRNMNNEMRERCYNNIREVVGRENAAPIIENLKRLTNEQYVQFFRENKDIESIGYDSDQTLFDFIDMTQEKFLIRLNNYER